MPMGNQDISRRHAGKSLLLLKPSKNRVVIHRYKFLLVILILPWKWKLQAESRAQKSSRPKTFCMWHSPSPAALLKVSTYWKVQGLWSCTFTFSLLKGAGILHFWYKLHVVNTTFWCVDWYTKWLMSSILHLKSLSSKIHSVWRVCFQTQAKYKHRDKQKTKILLLNAH